MNTLLHLGLTSSGKPFSLLADFTVQTAAILAIRGAGKTCLATVIAEEMVKAGLPWIALDPVGVWYGLRAGRDGAPNGLPVVIIGGDHGDIALNKQDGARIAEALIREPVYAVIDLSRESKRFWHTFLTDFCLKLMELSPEIPRHIFIEEAPEFVPQRTRVELTARCKEAVERLIRLGRNRGYGMTLISQRPATIDKDVLSQCENLFVMRTTGPHDRKALHEWIEAKASDKNLERLLNEMAGLQNGAAFFWSPHWLNVFEKIRIRPRETFHPGETRSVGKVQRAVALADVSDFVTRLKRQLQEKTVLTPRIGRQEIEKYQSPPGRVEIRPDYPNPFAPENDRLRAELAQERSARMNTEVRLEAVKRVLLPQYDAMRGLFENLQSSNGAAVDPTAYAPWLQKAGRAGTRRLLETIISRGELSRTQLATLSGLGPNTGTYRNYLSWLRRNGLVDVDGDTVRLKPL